MPPSTPERRSAPLSAPRLGRSGAGRRGLAGIAAVALAGGVAFPSGCQNRTAGLHGAPSAAVASAQDLFNAGRFAEAKSVAESDFRRQSGTARKRAALTAGMSSHALGKTAEARGWLQPLLSDADPEIAGRAAAALGLIAESQHDHAQAATYFDQAARQLHGDDAARAALRAGHAQTELKLWKQAEASYAAALAAAQSPAVRHAIEPYTRPGPFAIQLGLFSSKPNADRKSREVGPRMVRLGLGAPEVAPRKASNGTSGFAVLLGPYVNRYAAVAASEKIGVAAVVVPAVE